MKELGAPSLSYCLYDSMTINSDIAFKHTKKINVNPIKNYKSGTRFKPTRKLKPLAFIAPLGDPGFLAGPLCRQFGVYVFLLASSRSPNSSGLCRRKRGRARQPGAIHSMIYCLIGPCTPLLNICRSSYVCCFKVCSFSDAAVASAIARHPSSAVTVFLRSLRNRFAAPLTLRFH